MGASFFETLDEQAFISQGASQLDREYADLLK